MGNSTSKAPAPSSSSSSKRRSSSSGGKSGSGGGGKGGGTSSASAGKDTNTNKPQDLSSRAQQMVGDSYRDLQLGIQSGIKKLEEQDHPAAQLLDSICSPYLDHKGSFYSSDNDNDSHTVSEDETTDTYNNHNSRTRRKGGASGGGGRNDDRSMGEGESYVSNSDYESVDVSKPSHSGGGGGTHTNHHRPVGSSSKQAKESTDDDESEQIVPAVHHSKKPLASSFAKRCFFTKAGIGGQTQHYEGLTLTGNVVLMLAQAMKLKGCPTICDEDLRRVEQTYPNQFSRLPDELLLSSGWRRISKYCHFSNKPIPDGIPFFHSKQRLHPSGGYYFLLAAAVGMVRPIDVEPLTRDTLVLLETDYPTACDAAPDVLIHDPHEWTLVDKFCFFSGGPINQEDDVYYQADFDGNPIYMLAFLSPSLTPAELYKLDSDESLTSVAAVQEVESVYDLTDRDFDDLKLYHLGPCRALPPYILQPQAWTKVLPPHFLEARELAMLRAQEFEDRHHQPSHHHPSHHQPHQYHQEQTLHMQQHHEPPQLDDPPQHDAQHSVPPYPDESSYYEEDLEPFDGYARQVEEEGAFSPTELLSAHDSHFQLPTNSLEATELGERSVQRLDPPEDEPPSLKREDDAYYHENSEIAASSAAPKPEWGGDEEDYYESRETGKYYVTSEDSPSAFSPGISPTAMSPTSEQDYAVLSEVEDRSALQHSPRRTDLPPVSPRSPSSDVYSQHSAAMKGAQEMLRRNRLKRATAAAAAAAAQQYSAKPAHEPAPLQERDEEGLTSPNTDSESGTTTWESGSDFTGSSVWTDGSAPDRSSRRALILQMAKARMKTNKKTEEKKMDELDLGDLD